MTKPLIEKNAKFMVSVLKKSTNCGVNITYFYISPTSTYLVCGFVLTLHDIADNI